MQHKLCLQIATVCEYLSTAGVLSHLSNGYNSDLMLQYRMVGLVPPQELRNCEIL